MFTDATNDSDVESTHHEESPQSELDPLIQRDIKTITKKEACVARAQFLALCWSLFVIGWNDGSTGPLLPSIQNFYNVSCWPCFLFFKISHRFLQIGFGTVSWVFVVECTVSDVYRGMLWTITLHAISREQFWEQSSMCL
jgi:hypothetical protein